MPNVAKAKDGNVGKNNKGDGKRGRKMRGGGENFKQYCERFVLDNKREFDDAKSFVKDMFNNLYYAIDKIEIKGNWGLTKALKTNVDKVNKRDVLQKILKILKKTDDENDKQKGKDDEEVLDSITPSKKEKTNVKGILGIDGIDNTELISLLNYINLNMKNIITSYTKIKTTDIKKINGLEQFNKKIDFDENQLKTLFKYLLFLKIYKLFSEFADISVVEIISNIQIENAGDKGEGRPARTREGSTDTMENQSSVNGRGWNEGNTKSATNASTPNSDETGNRSSKKVRNQYDEGNTLLLPDKEDTMVSLLNEQKDVANGKISPIANQQIFVDKGNEIWYDIEQKILKVDTTDIDRELTKLMEKKEENQFDELVINMIKDLVINVREEVSNLLDIEDHMLIGIATLIIKIETFITTIAQDKIESEIERYVNTIRTKYNDEPNHLNVIDLIKEAGEKAIKSNNIYIKQLNIYLEFLKQQKGQDDPKRPQPESTDVSDIQQDPSNPHLLEKQNPLNVSRNPSASLRPIQSEDSELFSHIDKLQIDDNNEKKKDTAKSLKENYIYYIKIIKSYLLSNATTYYTNEQYMEKIKGHFDYIIDKAFKILNFDAITHIESELLLLENYNRDYTNRTFEIMRENVNKRYGDNDMTGYSLKTNAFRTITILQTNLNKFNFKCYDLLNVLYMNNKKDKIWTGGGQPRKSQRKEHINNTGAMKKKLTTKDPKANEPTAKKPTKTPKAKEPTKTPKANEPTAKEPTKTPKANEPTAKEPTKTPKANEPTAKEPTKTPKAKEPTKTPKANEPTAKEPTKTPKAKEPTKTPKAKNPTKDPNANEPTAKEPTKTPKPKEPTKTPKIKEPTKTPKQKEPTKTPKQKEPTKTPKAKEPTKTPKQKEPTKTPKQNEPTETPKAKEPKPHKPTKK
jgi:hypothetical protein